MEALTRFILLGIAMLFMHIFGDYWMQTSCFFASLKQKSWWENNIPEDCKPLDKSHYKYDYYVGLYEHAFSWAVCIELPLFIHCWFLYNPTDSFMKYCVLISLSVLVFINTIFHGVIDDLKANKFKINLIQDQRYHLFQMFITLMMYILLIGVV